MSVRDRVSGRIVALAVAVVTVMMLSGCSSPSAFPALPPVLWQQQLTLPSVLQAQRIGQDWEHLAGQHEFDWFDQSRQRQVPALLFKPKWQNQAAPLLVFSHGLGGSRERYAYLGQYWASQGYYSLHVQHDGSDRKVWRGSRLLLPLRLLDAADESEARARVADVRFALDQLLASELAGGIEPRQIIAAGHSYGANTAMLLAGAQVEQDGRLQSLQDPRISAAILISAPPFYNDQPLAEVLAKVAVPTLHITTTEDEIKVPGYYSAPADRLALFRAIASAYKVMAVFNGGSHNVFSGWRRQDEPAAQRQVIQAATQALSGAFVERVVRGDQIPLQQWQQQHQPLLALFASQ